MNDRKAQLVARIQELLAARKAELKAIAELEWTRPRVRLIRTFAALMLMVAAPLSAEARTVSRPVGYWIKQGGQTTVVLYAPPVRQTIIYETNVIRPTCPPAAAPTPRTRFQGSSKYAPSR